MKAILTETVLVSTAILFWAAALPAAIVFFPVATLWEKIATSMPHGPIRPGQPHLTFASS